MTLRPLLLWLAPFLVLCFGCGDDAPSDAASGGDAGLARDAENDAEGDASTADVQNGDAAADDAVTTDAPDASPPGEPLAENVLLIIADDFGVDSMSTYATPTAPDRTYPETPHLNAICEGGVQFDRAWSAPTCTPTRGTLFTGRFGFRTGLLGQDRDSVIEATEVTLPQALVRGLPTAMAGSFGKWHLGSSPALGGLEAPNTMGWSRYAGNIARALPAYDGWTKVVDGVESESTRYATTENVDDALAFIDVAGDAPWFVWLAVNSPHTPFHLPPSGHSRDDLDGTDEDIAARPRDYYLAMVETFDTEVGRLMETIDLSSTMVIFVGDNGSPAQVVETPLTRRRAKDTLYEGGLHVPLCVAGAGVTNPGRTHDALVHTVDLFSTILEAFGVPVPATDSVSMAPYLREEEDASAREWIFSELLDPRGFAIRGDRYKLIQYEDGSEEFYDLQDDPFERRDLMPSLDDDAALREQHQLLEGWATELRGRD